MIVGDDASPDTPPEGVFRQVYPDETLAETQGRNFFLPEPMARNIMVWADREAYSEVTLADVLEFYDHVMMKGS